MGEWCDERKRGTQRYYRMHSCCECHWPSSLTKTFHTHPPTHDDAGVKE